MGKSSRRDTRSGGGRRVRLAGRKSRSSRAFEHTGRHGRSVGVNAAASGSSGPGIWMPHADAPLLRECGRDRGALAALRGLRRALPRVALCATRTSRFRSPDRAVNDCPRGRSRLSSRAATTQSRRRALSKRTASPAAMPGTLSSAPTLEVGDASAARPALQPLRIPPGIRGASAARV